MMWAGRPSRRRVLALVASAVLLVTCLGTPAAALAVSSEPSVSEAKSAIICDSEGNVLWSLNADDELPEASITKLMTAVVALDSNPDMSSTVTLSDVSLIAEAQVAGYKGGSTSTFRELMQVMLVYSANDAAVEVARAVAGSEEAFVDRMNQKAAELGLTHTHFANVHGLDADGHYSSVQDLVTLARYAFTTYPFIAQTVHRSSVTVDVNGTEKTFAATDELLGAYSGMLGGKTGAGDGYYTFLGVCRRNGVQLYTCVLGCSTETGRFTDTTSMLDWAYATYQRHTLANAARVIRVEPYAMHFGWSVEVSADRISSGYFWPSGEGISYASVHDRAGMLEDVDEPWGVCLWNQGGRVVGVATFSTGTTIIKTPTWQAFGLQAFLAQAA